MTGLFLLDWAIQACSLFNGGLMLWLGLTIALNAERRAGATAEGRGPAWGPALIAGSLLAGALFFISHSAILAFDLNTVSRGLNFWWRVGWWPVLALPLAWYVLVLWYAGYWSETDTALHRRHRLGLVACALSVVALVLLVLFANPLPELGPLPSTGYFGLVSIGGVPLLVLAYPLFIVLCLGLSLDALLRPGPTARVLGEQARRRARPWLAAATGLLLLVGLLVAWVMFWVLSRLGPPLVIDTALGLTIGWFDLAISSLIAAAVVVVGQALVAYEVFTGKTLPRRGLLRFWRNAVALCAGYALLAAWSLALELRPIYAVLLTAALLSAFYALISWRAYAEREAYMRQLRPFVAGQPLYQQLLAQAQAAPPTTSAGEAQPAADPQTTAARASFQALCRDVLGARLAYLVPLGPVAPLAGPLLRYPDEAGSATPPIEALAALAALVTSREVSAVGAPATQAGGATLALPLWSESPRAAGAAAAGLIGLLLLGEKADGGLYTQEEIDIARAGGERLIDALASAELARRLLALQRQRLAESQVVDQRTRRVIHDDVLPQLHAALLHLNALEATAGATEATALLSGAHRQLAELLRELPAGPLPEVARLGLVDALRKSTAGEFARSFDRVTWALTPEAEAQARALPALTAEVLFNAAREALRNAARHGRRAGAAPLTVQITLAQPRPGGLALTIADDGPGLNGAGPQGSSSAPPSGAGQGLALHATLLAVVGGTLTVESAPGAGTRVRLVV